MPAWKLLIIAGEKGGAGLEAAGSGGRPVEAKRCSDSILIFMAALRARLSEGSRTEMSKAINPTTISSSINVKHERRRENRVMAHPLVGS
jgi:hypothetical protein